jgi:hypothetical protein
LLASRQLGRDLFKGLTGVGDKSVSGTHETTMVPAVSQVGGNVG